MHGVVYRAPGVMVYETVADPGLRDRTDAVVRVTKAAICGSDLHGYRHGDALGISPGCRIGHEFVGIVEEVGSAVRHVKPGDKVLAPFWYSCGACDFCRDELYTSCIHGGCFGFEPAWTAGGAVEGCQAEFVRVPYADGTLEVVPEILAAQADDLRVLPLGDVFSTAFHGVTGARIRPGDTVVVVGDGAVGLSAVLAATLFGPAAVVLAGHHDDRLALGAKLGATHTVNTAGGGDAAALAAELTDGRGPPAVIATISDAPTISWAVTTVRPGGTVAWTGMETFFSPPQPPGDVLFLKNVTITGGVCPSRRYIRHLWPLVASGRIDPSPIFTHDLPLDRAVEGYELMAGRETGSVKVALTP
jgi:threonine dehydrogenase-like Zn-dependent dehydrogenase